MSTRHISLIACRELIEKFVEEEKLNGIEISEPVAVESPTDMLDAPIGIEEVKVYLEVITVAINTTAAGALLVDRILKMVKEYKGAFFKVQDPKSGREVGQLDGATSRTEAEALISK
jgi:hypothetical protein